MSNDLEDLVRIVADRPTRGVLVVHVSGEVDLCNCDALVDELERCRERVAATSLVIDVAELFIDVRGVRAVVAWARTVRRQTRTAIAGASPVGWRVWALLDPAETVLRAPTVQAARRAIATF